MGKELLDFEKKFIDIFIFYLNKSGLTNKCVATKIYIEPSLISKWTSKETSISIKYLGTLQSLLGIPEQEISEYKKKKEEQKDLLKQNKRAKEKFIAESLLQSIEKGFTENNISKEIYEIDLDWPAAEIEPPDEGSNDFGHPLKWQSFRSEFSEHTYLIREKLTGNCVAYWQAISIKDNLYWKAREGLNINKSCDRNDLANFFLPRDHKMYLADVWTRKKYMHTYAINKVMGRSFFEYLLHFALSGHFFSHIITHASSIQSEELCESYKFDFICQHLEHRRYESEQNRNIIPTKIYELDLKKKGGEFLSISKNFLSTSEVEKLLELYKSHFPVI